MKVRVIVQGGRRGVAGEPRRVIREEVVEGSPGPDDELAVGFDPRDFQSDEFGEVVFQRLPVEGGEPRSVRGCARCGEDHARVVFRELEQPMEPAPDVTWTHWGSCPTNGEPILLRTIPPVAFACKR